MYIDFLKGVRTMTDSALFCLFITGQDCPFVQPIADGQSVWDHYFCNSISVQPVPDKWTNSRLNHLMSCHLPHSTNTQDVIAYNIAVSQTLIPVLSTVNWYGLTNFHIDVLNISRFVMHVHRNITLKLFMFRFLRNHHLQVLRTSHVDRNNSKCTFKELACSPSTR